MAGASNRLLILLADDDPARARDLHVALRGAGVQPLGPVRTVEEGLALLDNLRERPAGAIVNPHLRDGGARPLLGALAARAIPSMLLEGTGGGAAETLATLTRRFPRA